MTEKRFKLGYVCGDFGLIDNDEWIDLHSMSENSEKNVRICINKMNELSDENKQLKNRIDNYNTALKKLQDLTERKMNENEQLKQFKEKVFKLIDDNIQIYEDTTTNDEFLQIQLDTKLQTLYNLRKEL